jgi:DNA repair exonuclease SbcCD ATPase subunit
VAGWLVTTYPAETDLVGVAALAGSLPALRKELERLDADTREWQRLDARRQQAEDQKARVEQTLVVSEAMQARVEQEALHPRATELDEQIEAAGKECECTRKAAEKAVAAAEAAHRQYSDALQDEAKAVTARDEMARSLSETITRLPEGWQETAQQINRGALQVLQEEEEQLRPYRQLHEELGKSRQAAISLSGRQVDVEAEIGRLPDAARRAPSEVDQELGAAREERQVLDDHRGNAARLAAEQERLRDERLAVDEELRQVVRQRHLASRLADVLGPRGLQLFLLRRAEQGIVALANEMLAGLSRGRMRLELRNGGGGEPASDEALDLLVYDRETGTKPVLASLVSGSQKFRIAVSLALAIGRYASREARRIESVIIDEGFGSLDPEGRDDMVQELGALQQQLERIILVSHQDEFSSAFANGYRIQLHDGASRVQPLACT